jgi:hypothetical protein
LKTVEEYWLDVAHRVDNPREAFYCGAVAILVMLGKVGELTGDDAINARNHINAQIVDALAAMEDDRHEPD